MQGYAKDYLMSILIMKLLTSYDHITSQILPTAFICMFTGMHTMLGMGGGTHFWNPNSPKIPKGKNFQMEKFPKSEFPKIPIWQTGEGRPCPASFAHASAHYMFWYIFYDH